MSVNPFANILDSIIQSFDLYGDNLDLYHSLTEFAVGFPRESRPLDLCYGLSLYDNNTPNYILTFGESFVRINGAATPTTFNINTNDLLTVNLLSLLPLNTYVDQAIATGSIFLTYNGTSLALQVVPYINASNIILTLPDTTNSVEDLLLADQLLVAPTTPAIFLELYRVIITVGAIYVQDDGSGNLYIPSQYNSWSFSTSIYDYRKPRGFPGYAEPTLAVSMMDTILSLEDVIQLDYNTKLNVIIKMVNDWIANSLWSPDFITYWKQNAMPLHLKQFIADYFGIGL